MLNVACNEGQKASVLPAALMSEQYDLRQERHKWRSQSGAHPVLLCDLWCDGHKNIFILKIIHIFSKMTWSHVVCTNTLKWTFRDYYFKGNSIFFQLWHVLGQFSLWYLCDPFISGQLCRSIFTFSPEIIFTLCKWAHIIVCEDQFMFYIHRYFCHFSTAVLTIPFWCQVIAFLVQLLPLELVVGCCAKLFWYTLTL